TRLQGDWSSDVCSSDLPHEAVYHFRAAEHRRRHVADHIRHCDVDLKTERRGSPHTLVCTKNTASYQVNLNTFHRDQEHLATIERSEERRVGKECRQWMA